MNKLQQITWNKKTIGICVAIVAIIVLASCFGFYKNQLSAVGGSDEPIYFEIIEGDTASSIITRLDEQTIIRNKTAAKIHSKFSGNNTFHVGTYVINKTWNTPAILKYLSDPANIKDRKSVV